MRKHKTFILEWNPAISSYTWERFEADLAEEELPWEFNWSIWDHEQVRYGDRFYLIKCGEGKTGIVMSGTFCGEAYEAEDWSGHGRQTFYANMNLDTMINSEKCPILTTEELEAAVPDFQWKGGHSGRVLPENYAKTLDEMWKSWLKTHRDVFDMKSALYDEYEITKQLASELDIALEIALEAHKGTYDLDGNPVILHPLAVCNAGKTETEKVVGLLHDVVEDSAHWSFKDLASAGISTKSIAALKLLTKAPGRDYMEYVKNICESGNKTALHVKVNDLRNNISRGLSGGHAELVKKHTTALMYILQQHPELR